jgi:hypothetical protein
VDNQRNLTGLNEYLEMTQQTQYTGDIMGFGSIITRAFISGAIRAVADAAREQARIERANQSSKPLREIASVATKGVSLPTTAISARRLCG